MFESNDSKGILETGLKLKRELFGTKQRIEKKSLNAHVHDGPVRTIAQVLSDTKLLTEIENDEDDDDYGEDVIDIEYEETDGGIEELPQET